MAITTRGKDKGRELAVASLKDLLVKQNFKEELSALREKFGIPLTGYPLELREDGLPQSPPLAWLGVCSEAKDYEDENIRFALINEVAVLFGKYGFQTNLGLDYDPFEHIVFYNDLPEEQNTFMQYFPGVCFFEDATIDMQESKAFEELKDKNFPIVLRISPNATQNNLVDFIKKDWERFSALQKHHSKTPLLIGKSRKKPMGERDQFIFENQKLKREELLKIWPREKYGDLPDPGALSKIISLQNNKRK